MKHLLVIGRPPGGPAKADTETIAQLMPTEGTVLVRRCDRPEDLVNILEEATKSGGLIDLLDVFDHAAPGAQWLGSDLLFASNGDQTVEFHGLAIATAIREFLSPNAQVRLLGCKSACQIEGRVLLYKLTAALGERRLAVGTVGDVDSNDFDAAGFKIGNDRTYLFDGRAAIDGEAPDRPTRLVNVAWLA